jgi:hypothetical protein
MAPRAQKIKPTAGAMRASKAIQQDAGLLESLPELIDHETGVRELLDILQSIISQAGDLIESRSPNSSQRPVLRSRVTTMKGSPKPNERWWAAIRGSHHLFGLRKRTRIA